MRAACSIQHDSFADFLYFSFHSELCHQNFLCSHWQSSHHSFNDETFVGTRIFTCLLLYSCEAPLSTSSEYPLVTNSGSRVCNPDPFRRRPCSACPPTRKFCHGRCPYNNIRGAKCLFAICSKNPYREDIGSTCSQLAMEAEKYECSEHCEDISSPSSCQDCITNSIDENCEHSSGASCWYCGGTIIEKWRQCSNPGLDSIAVVECIEQAIVPGCSQCICTLLCYWSPTGALCKSCLHQPELAHYFLHHQSCPQGWVYSASSSSCFKAFNLRKTWSYANSFCQSGGGRLAQTKSSIQGVLEGINLLQEAGLFWVGGKETVVSCGQHTAFSCSACPGHHGEFWCNGDCVWSDGQCSPIGDGPDGTFIWTEDNSLVDDQNWDHGFPKLGSFVFYLLLKY